MSAVETQPIPPVTAEQFSKLAASLGRCELIEGRIVTMAPAHGPHGVAGQRLAVAVAHWVADHELGETVLAETGFVLATEPDTVRAPDLAVIPADRMPDPVPDGWLGAVPVLTIEVASADARQAEVLHKVGLWLDFGVSVVWVLYLGQRCLVEFRAGDLIRRFGEDDTVTCEDVLPGFAYPLGRALRGIA
ncbi:MAG: Uma2 family endonuclease [Armatimonadetes bacterium]|nr:Uma2 family endonuclease [Armatimonadota bacterium]